ncbi:MAG: Holliday junction branch migration protein RuvA [Cytophagales bacterium]|nr:Holliday junction branch migration protein RuvA [Cytophagales bacterium]MDW8384470.1 Holliday junction branch migration protein RuvA [Flammeovirgaceae bacterium]
MYAYLRGKIVHLTPTFTVIETSSGIAFEVRIPLSTSCRLTVSENSILLFTHFYVNREGEQSLFGFLSEQEKEIFVQLVSVSGVGPSTALAFLSSLSSEEIVEAIAKGDIKTIKSIKGIGAKTAERVILELKEKFQKRFVVLTPKAGLSAIKNKNIADALEALMHLGVPKAVAEKNIQTVLEQQGEHLSTEAIIRLALKTK